jgi:ATP-dependent Clp protease, protease subunit
MEEKTIISLDDNSNRPRPKPIGLLHTFYISGVIEDAKTYTDWFEVIRNANDTDLIKIHINSPGGDLFTAIQFMRVLNESNAMIIASVEGACMSAATMIFLCANQFEISEHSMFMFHNYSGMAIGKGGEMYDNITHERKWSEKIMRKVYENFLTEEEIKAILDNKDIWMEGEEVLKRLKLKQKVLEEKRMRKTNAKKPDPKS